MVGLVAFVGAALGSALGYLGAARATRAEQGARRREEWGRRFTHALELSLSRDRKARSTGRRLLTLLSVSELASDEERRYADAVLRGRFQGDAAPRSLGNGDATRGAPS